MYQFHATRSLTHVISMGATFWPNTCGCSGSEKENLQIPFMTTAHETTYPSLALCPFSANVVLQIMTDVLSSNRTPSFGLPPSKSESFGSPSGGLRFQERATLLPRGTATPWPLLNLRASCSQKWLDGIVVRRKTGTEPRLIRRIMRIAVSDAQGRIRTTKLMFTPAPKQPLHDHGVR